MSHNFQVGARICDDSLRRYDDVPTSGTVAVGPIHRKDRSFWDVRENEPMTLVVWDYVYLSTRGIPAQRLNVIS